jgi:hypothetical protein
MMEVAKGKVAAQKGSHEGVKQFGQRMVDDHTKANDELKSIAGAKNITLPDETPKPPMQAAFAEKTLPTLKEHLTMVRDLKTKLAKGGTN